MKQVVQALKTGQLTVIDVPSPSVRPRGILVRTAASLVSAGTERMVVEFAEKNVIAKARARPDLVKQVVEKAQREGVISTLESVRNRLDQPMALGYSSAGVVAAVGAEAGSFRVGDRVACAGGGYASHAEQAYVPRNLAVKIPDNVSFEEAAFGTVGAIALQGIRQGDIQLGDNVAVIGLGLIGQLSVQMLKAAGCRVVGIDPRPDRVALARALGADVAVLNREAGNAVSELTQDRGVDAVLITADSPTNEPVVLAGEIARDRGIVVAVGAVDLAIPRKIYYEKELDLRLSRSYGPGRYDAEYEEKGLDYPYGYVRWTEQRNDEAVITLISEGKLDVRPLITHRFAIEDAEQAYEVVTGKTGDPFLGVILTYDVGHELPDTIATREPTHDDPLAEEAVVGVGMVGAGNFVNATLLPAMKGIDGLSLVGIVSGSGMSARSAADRFGFAFAASGEQRLLADPTINWVVVATRHDQHADQAIAALDAGKNVFVEKPLALTEAQLERVARARENSGGHVMVGFNRRFAPMIVRMKQFLEDRQRPVIATCRINAGAIPRVHWVHDPLVGGGRIIGEGCHFIDLLSHLVGAPITSVEADAVLSADSPVEDEVLITIRFADGSLGSIVYSAGGDKAFGKERIEVIGDGKIATLDDFRSLELVSHGKRQHVRERLSPKKGHREEWEALVAATRNGGTVPIPFSDIVRSHLATFAAVESMRTRQVVHIDEQAFWDAVSST